MKLSYFIKIKLTSSGGKLKQKLSGEDISK